MTDLPRIIPFRKAEPSGPTLEQWEQARLKCEANKGKFAAVVCEDDDGAIFVLAVNVESQLHAEAMVHQAGGCFREDDDGE